MPVITPVGDVEQFTGILLTKYLMPAKALMNALHFAVAVEARLDYLLMLNCKHFANSHTLPYIYKLIRHLDLHCPLIPTHSDFLGN